MARRQPSCAGHRRRGHRAAARARASPRRRSRCAASWCAAACPTAGSTSTRRTTPRSCWPGSARAPRTPPWWSPPTAGAAPPDPGPARRAPRAHLPAGARVSPSTSSWWAPGPAGLAASVYGASEGLSMVALEAISAGGQAGTSSRIENYLGFPQGFSGLSSPTGPPCRRSASAPASPTPASPSGCATRPASTSSALRRQRGARPAVVLATGAEYRRPAVDRWAELEGRGIYYAATETEGRLCAAERVAVLGGGQLGRPGRALPVQQGLRGGHRHPRRGPDPLDEPLPDRPHRGRHPHQRHPRTVVCAVHGDDRLTGSPSSAPRREPGGHRPRPALFCFIGAVPATSWLSTTIATDDRRLPAHRPRPQPDRLGAAVDVARTSAPALRDQRPRRVRGRRRALRLIKRVAAAVGEGSTAVSSVHTHLALVR